MCAAAARSEQEFFAGLDSAGLLVRLRHSPGPGDRVRGQPARHDSLGRPAGLVRRPDPGRAAEPRSAAPPLAGRPPGTPPAPEAFAAADTRDIFGYATTVAAEAARQLRVSPSAAQSADIAWAAADVLTAAAQATGSPELQQAADGFSRAGRRGMGAHPGAVPRRRRAAHRRVPAGRVRSPGDTPEDRPSRTDQRPGRAGRRGSGGPRGAEPAAAGRRGP